MESNSVQHNNLSLAARIEAVLFYKAEPVSFKKLGELLDTSKEKITAGIEELEEKLQGSGLQLVRNDDEIMLGTAKEAGELIETLTREETSRDLGKAGLETLAIVLYKGPISRREIDYIRGVNSAFILRNLMVRGLIERREASGKERGYTYVPTTGLLSFMGLGTIENLPEYAAIRAEMEQFSKTAEANKESETSA